MVLFAKFSVPSTLAYLSILDSDGQLRTASTVVHWRVAERRFARSRSVLRGRDLGRDPSSEAVTTAVIRPPRP
jgi:hypothetical protein